MSVINTELECARNIALLYYLGRIGCKHQKNNIQDCEPIRKSDISRVLSLQDEKLLTSTLAFLSSIRDDALKVTAVCVEEKKSSVVVMVAANAKDSHAHHRILTLSRKGLIEYSNYSIGRLQYLLRAFVIGLSVSSPLYVEAE
ncbi:uncharacterized protein BKA55DRAFT_159456 [Fusarium redolens]|uniref:Uncharacterized protein n=1 Tax=Fusarium redolens TaxID=48865 RepID=A0A9P9R687_FUSRE|nr:uncharacterized protein BKA55DRAFT_159456 [Fusarium redolens]KAH7266980.1 hypothetical protein BKA55DRAFT_159456 [Fusarium redolens]